MTVRIGDDALYGLPGEVVRTIDPHTEADPTAVLINTLVFFGNVIGRGPYFKVEETHHYTNLYSVLVGETSKARKGQSASAIKRVFEMVDHGWKSASITSGLSTGEGLIFNVRDPRPTRNDFDLGVLDKRLLVLEEEFSQPLKLMKREGNILSATIRDAWDGNDLHPMTKTDPIRATAPHISLIGHITRDELLRHLTETEMGNGFANRFICVHVERSKLIPSPTGVPPADLEALAGKMRAAVQHACSVQQMTRDQEAEALWCSVYPRLSEGKPGLVGAITSRAEAQVLRLSCLYALADCSAVVQRSHLEAALALWEYSEQSVRLIFGDRLGDPTADRILKALSEFPEINETRVRDLFNRHNSSDIDRALDRLQRLGLATCRQEKTGGRPQTLWRANRANSRSSA